MIEAELKARVRDPDALRDRLRRLATEEISVYHDTYYDTPDQSLTTSGRELRLRVIETGNERRPVLTYKEPAVDTATDSRPEHETTVGDADVADVVFAALGMEHLVAFRKHCANYRFIARGRDMLATVVTVPELDGVFLEVETQTEEPQLDQALSDIRGVLLELGVAREDLTIETYTEAVRQARL
jgi:adenylate cyclase, class 2